MKQKVKQKVKRLGAVLLTAVCVMGIAYPVTGEATQSTGGQKERKKKFIVRVMSEQQAVQLEKKYETSDSISKLGEKNLQEHSLAALELTDTEARKLEENESVQVLEPDIVVTASALSTRKVVKRKTKKGKQEQGWNWQAIHAKKEKQGKKKNVQVDKVKVALLDSGVDLFNDIEVKESINLIPKEEEVLPLFWDTSGHGTSIAGVLAAQENGEGITGIHPNVELYSARVLDGEKSAPVSRIVEAIYWAMEKQVDIISISFGTTQYSEVLEKAIKEAYNKGILIIAAAGNKKVVEYPAAMEEVVAVGGTDVNGEVCDYSARGEEVELVAPADQIRSTGSFDGTVISSGTSMAVPHVVGVAAKLWEKDRKKSADFIRQLMNASANLYGDTKEYGNGLVDYAHAEKIYDDFAKNYRPQNTQEENEEKIEKNLSPIEKFVDVNDVNGSWEGAEHKTCVTVATKGKGIAQATITAMKKGAIYPDKAESTVNGMGKYPYMHGYFKYDGSNALSNYVLSYIDLTKEAEEIRRGRVNYINTITLPYVPAANTFYKRIGWSNQGCTNNAQKGVFAWGVAIHNATDVYAHSIYGHNGEKFVRFYHNKEKNGNAYADNAAVVGERFEVAKDVAKNILSHYVKGEKGVAKDFVSNKYNASRFKVYNLDLYVQKAGDSSTANNLKKYSVR